MFLLITNRKYVLLDYMKIIDLGWL